MVPGIHTSPLAEPIASPTRSTTRPLRDGFDRRPTLLIAAALLASATLTQGCQSANGYLLILSGDPVASERGLGGLAIYAVHVGERPRLRFHERFSAGDYAVCLDEQSGLYEDCGPPLGTLFEWRRPFDRPTAEGQPLRLTARSYRQNGKRDSMPFDGKLVFREGVGDIGDDLWAVGQVLVRVYQSVVEFDVALPGRSPDWSLTQLSLYRGSRRTEVRQAQPSGRGGFAVRGPDADGRWRVSYEPTAEQIETRGTTRAVLVVADDRGRTTRFERTFTTP